MERFCPSKLIEALKPHGITISSVESKEIPDVVYVNFDESNIKWIRAAATYDLKNNCINIYHGYKGCSKNGYWWDGSLDYAKLAAELLQYHGAVRTESEVFS